MPVVIFRLFNTVGPRQTGQYGMVVPRFVRQALQGERLTVYGDGRQSRCFCDVDDAVRAIIGLADCPGAVGEVVNIGATTENTILVLARQVIAMVAGERARPSAAHAGITFIPYEQAYEAGFEDMQRRRPDISKIKALIGWEPRISLEQTLARVIDSLRPTSPAP